MYKLFTDKTEEFTADIQLEGASLKDSFARLVVESDDWNLVFKGEISNTGKVTIPVKKLRRVLDEGTMGNLKLEVVAEDTYFIPWESEFEVEASKKVRVEVKSQQNSKTIKESKKPKVKVTSVKESKGLKSSQTHKELFKEYVNCFKGENITLENIKQKQPLLKRETSKFIKKKNLNESQVKWLQSQYLKFLVLKTNK